MGIYINDGELEAMQGVSPEARCAYIWLRSRMDWRTGLVGRATKISHYAIGVWLDYEVPKGAGTQLMRVADTPARIKEAGRRLCEQLERVGLLVKRAGCAVMTFFCPMASLSASPRQNQTGRERAAQLHTERAAPAGLDESSIYAGFEGVDVDWRFERATPDEQQNPPNGPHIVGRRFTQPQSSSTDSTGVGADLDENAGGLNRDRASPSQACPLGRTGENEEGVYRDQASPSHAGQLSQPGNTYTDPDRDRASPSEAGGPAQRSGASSSEGAGETPGGLAENELAPLPARSASNAQVAALVEGLNRRAVRVPTKPDVLLEWVAMGVTPLELDLGIERALAERIKAGSQQRVTVGYVAPIILTMRSEARRAAEVARQAVSSPKRARADEDLEALAKELGIAGARPGETAQQFRLRVLSAAEAAMGRSDG